MIIIKKMNTYRDGGSIGIDAWMSSGENEDLKPCNPLITIDRSFPDGDGEWYNGWKKDGGSKIEDREFKSKVISAIEDHIAQELRILATLKALNL